MSLLQDPPSGGSLELTIPESKTMSHTRVIGMIRPPQDIRTIVDKTAHFVAKKGPEFVKRIVAENAGNSKFHFLSSLSPYHAYYQHRLSEFRDGNQQPADSAELESGAPQAPAIKGEAGAPVPDPFDQFKPQYTVRIPEGITGEEYDIIKLTAEFVAREGKSFLAGLTSREIKNCQLNFLKPGSVMFALFTSLSDAYSKVLLPPEGLTEKLRKTVADMETVLQRCVNRLESEQSQEKERRKVEDEIERERIQMAMNDWFDFVVVETIDFSDNEDQRRRVKRMEEDDVEFEKAVDMEMDDEEMQLVEEGLATKDIGEPMRVVKNWKRPEERIHAERNSMKYVVSPITGELIPISEISKIQRAEREDLAQDDEISRNIMGLARTRPDSFGTTEEEVSNVDKAEIEKKKDEQEQQVIRDGHTGSIGFNQNYVLKKDAMNLPGPAAPPPKSAVPSVRPLPPPPGSTLNLPCAYIPLPVPLPTMQSMPPLPLPQVIPPPPPEKARPPRPEEEPEPKRQKLDDYMLIPEDQFLTQHPGPGQVLEIIVQSLSESVVKLKEKISAEIHLPANKQKLSGKPGFLKDNLSLAYYNVGGGETFTLSVRERGRRKR
ncbi:unnamed protein product [Malus baccata var. baccata]